MDTKELIARRAAVELHDGDVVNLGIGLPTLIPNYLPAGINIILQSENGYIGLGPVQDTIIPDLVNAGGKPANILPGVPSSTVPLPLRSSAADMWMLPFLAGWR